MKELFNKLYSGTKNEFFSFLSEKIQKKEKMFIVTANPETFMTAQKDIELKNLLLDTNTTVLADGIGIVKGAKILGTAIPDRIAGVEVAEQLLYLANKYSKKVYFLGSTQNVLDKLCQVISKKYPNINVVGAMHGYTEDKDIIFNDINIKAADIVLVALGVPAQEKLINKHISCFEKGIFIGVGGSLDVLSGTKKRAPKLFIKCNLEWLYRILKEPSRIKRFYNNNVKFIIKLSRYKN